MMKEISHFLRFSLEITTLCTLVYLALNYYSGIKKIMIGLVLPIMIILLWSILMAPKSNLRLQELGRLVIEILLFGAVILLLFANKDRYTYYYMIFALTSTLMDHIYQ